MSPAAIAAAAVLGVLALACLVAMRRIITYAIAADRLDIRVFGVPVMMVPYSDIVQVRVGSWFLTRFRPIQFTNAMRPLRRSERAPAADEILHIRPEDPQVLVDALAAYRTRHIEHPELARL